MTLDLMYQQQLFERWQAGHRDSLMMLFDRERPYLFDYLLRMTGDMQRSLDTLEMVGETMSGAGKRWQTINQLRFDLYVHSRGLNNGLWHGNVGLLENQALARILHNEEASSQDKKRAMAYARLDRAIGASAAEQREVLILHLRCKFTFSEIVRLTGHTRDKVEQLYGETMRFLQGQVSNLPQDPRSVITRLVPHPFPEAPPSEITDLQELMGGLKKDQSPHLQSSTFSMVIILLLTFGGLLVVAFAKPEAVAHLTGLVKQFFFKIAKLVL